MCILWCGNVSLFTENTVCGISIQVSQMWPQISCALFHRQRSLCVCQRTSTEFWFWGWGVMTRRRYKLLKNDLLTSTIPTVMNGENKRGKKRKDSGVGEGKNQGWMEQQEEARSERIEFLDGCRRLRAFVSEWCDGSVCCGPCWTIFVDLSLFPSLMDGPYR